MARRRTLRNLPYQIAVWFGWKHSLELEYMRACPRCRRLRRKRKW